ncbi:MAG: hypothetical protein ACRDSM_19560, partial [Pseudonocardiaceae bacterium]
EHSLERISYLFTVTKVDFLKLHRRLQLYLFLTANEMATLQHAKALGIIAARLGTFFVRPVGEGGCCVAGGLAWDLQHAPYPNAVKLGMGP